MLLCLLGSAYWPQAAPQRRGLPARGAGEPPVCPARVDGGRGAVARVSASTLPGKSSCSLARVQTRSVPAGPAPASVRRQGLKRPRTSAHYCPCSHVHLLCGCATRKAGAASSHVTDSPRTISSRKTGTDAPLAPDRPGVAAGPRRGWGSVGWGEGCALGWHSPMS